MTIEERRLEAARIRGRRLALGWTQEELAARAGVALGTVGNAENGTAVPQPGRLGMMLAALDVGEQEFRSRPVLIGPGEREGLTEWMQEIAASHSKADRASIVAKYAQVHDSLRAALEACWPLLELDVDIQVVERIVDNATEAFIASGAYAAISAAGVAKADEFLTQSSSLSREIKRRREAGELGRPSFISKLVDDAREQGIREGIERVNRRGSANNRDASDLAPTLRAVAKEGVIEEYDED